MSKRELSYNSRLAYLFLIDNLDKYREGEFIDHIKAVNDFTDNVGIKKSLTDYIDLIWEIKGTDKHFIQKIRRATKRSVYSRPIAV